MRAIITLTAIVIGACSPVPEPDGVQVVQSNLVSVDGSGTGCTAAGWTWNPPTKTCRMTSDLVNQGVSITENNVTLDCDGHTVCQVTGTSCTDPASDAGVDTFGILVYTTFGQPLLRDITVKNCNVKGFNHSAVWVNYAERISIQHLTTTGNSAYNAYPAVSWAQRLPKVALRVNNVNDSEFTDLDLSGSSDAVIELKYGYFNRNLFRDITMRDVLGVGIVVSTAGGGVGSDLNVFEDIVAETVDGRLQQSVLQLQDITNFTTVRRATILTKSSVTPTGYGFGTGISVLEGRGVLIEDCLIAGASRAGISIGNLAAFSGIATLRNNLVIRSGGGSLIGSSGGGTVKLVDNTFCNDPTQRYTVNSPPNIALKNADVTMRFNSTVTPPGIVVGTNNTCGFVDRCDYSGSTVTCSDPPPLPYRDLDAPAGSPCARTCN